MKFAAILIIVLSIIIFLPSAYSELEDDREVLLGKATNAYNDAKFDDAIYFLDQILEVDNDNVEALYIKGISLLGLRDIEEGLQYLDRVLEIDSNHTLALNAKAAQLIQQEKLSEAMQYYDRILEIEPHAGDIFGTLIADKILALNPENIEGLNAKGTSMISLDRTEKGHTVIFADKLDDAISYFDKVLSLEPNNTDALFNKGRALIQKAKTGSDQEDLNSYFEQEGLSYIDKVLEINPNHVGAITFKADQLITASKYSEAIALADKALAIDPNFEQALFVKGSALAQDKKFPESINYFVQVLQKNHGNKLAELNLSASTAKTGYLQLDGFLDVMVHDSNGFLVDHVRVTKLNLLNHTMGEDLINGWPVVSIVKRNGTDYELRQFEKNIESHYVNLYGGAIHYGIPFTLVDTSWLITANYWMYYVHEGDKITFVYSAFTPV